MSERASKRLRAPSEERESGRLMARVFSAGDAINPEANYYVEWDDRDELLTEITDHSRWLLITGPWQSGKSSLMYALAESAERKGFHPVVTILSSQMVAVANDLSKNEIEAGNAFFELLANRLVGRSRKALRRGSSQGIEGVTEMFLEPQQKEIIWFIDEASLLNDVKRVSIVQMFLSELRQVKQDCVSRRPKRGGVPLVGGYYLRSFVLVGTPKLKQLIGDSPLGESVSPLSMERSRVSDVLSVEGIVMLLNDYRLEHDDADFRLDEGPSADGTHDAAIRKLSKSIWSLTSGHKGMVITCCEFLARQSLFTYTLWEQQVRVGHVAKYVFYSKVYSKVVSNITEYPEAAREVILKCIETGASVTIAGLYLLLRPLNDGVLESVGENMVALTSGLLLSAFLEDCSFAPLESLPNIGSFVEVVHWAFPFMNHERLIRDEVLNANGQPSEYAWQSEFLLALKFVLEHGYKDSKYTVMVEAKRKDEKGQRRTRLDFLLKNAGSPSKGFELQGAGDRASIKKHIKRSLYYAELHHCEMHYVYLQYGSFGVNAKAVIKEEAANFLDVNCWFVQYLLEAKEWRIEQLKQVDSHWEWLALRKDAATSFPRFIFNKRRKVDF